jgi:hypothetical protein
LNIHCYYRNRFCYYFFDSQTCWNMKGIRLIQLFWWNHILSIQMKDPNNKELDAEFQGNFLIFIENE